MPLYGIVSSSKSDPIYWMRPILASSKDSLMELGILPLITANMIIQLFSALGVLSQNNESREDSLLINQASKMLTI